MSSSGSECDVSISIGDDGRVEGTPAGLSYAPAAHVGTLSARGATPAAVLDALRADCAEVFDGCSTFWLPAAREPRCALEHLARAVFRHHTRGVAVDPARSGAEFWCQVRDGPTPIRFHWDKDESLLDAGGANVHPQISTVTYLTDAGAPTVVVDQRCPTNAEDLDLLYNDEPARQAWISRPQAGKHFSFDGRLLHGVPTELGGAEGRRVTFLVNIWLAYKPFNVEELPDDVAARLSSHPVRYGLSASTAQNFVRMPAARRLEFFFGPETGSDHCLELSVPKGPITASSVHLRFGPQHRARVVFAEPPELTAVPRVDLRPNLDWDRDIAPLYAKYQIVHLVRGADAPAADWEAPLDVLRKFYAAERAAVSETWAVEHGRAGRLLPDDVLGEDAGTDADALPRTWYCSFVLSEGPATALLSALPSPPPVLGALHHTNNVWAFFGRNGGRRPAVGRPEHTDQIVHDGTWHLQTSGAKRWVVRPNDGVPWPAGPCPVIEGGDHLSVVVGEGDLLLVNTQRWYHSTRLDSSETPSCSYARDFYLSAEAVNNRPVAMDNLEDVWATADIAAGQMIAKGRSIPDVLVDDDPTCTVAVSARGVPQLVARSDIPEGERLTVSAEEKRVLEKSKR